MLDRVDLATAERAAGPLDGLGDHPFPTCFVCGPDRLPGDGLRLTPGWLEDREEETACTWVPDDSVDLAQTWAAMDCPGGWSGGMAGRPMVLGTMAARVERPAVAGERCVVVGRHLGADGRKTRSAATLWSVGGPDDRPRRSCSAPPSTSGCGSTRPRSGADGAGGPGQARSTRRWSARGRSELGAQPGEVELAADAEVAHHVAGERRGRGTRRARATSRAPSPSPRATGNGRCTRCGA